MSSKAEKKTFNKDLFKLRKNDFALAEEIAGESLTFWQDAARRLRKNTVSMISLGAIILILLLAIFGPIMNKYSYEERVLDNKRTAAKIPPRIPVLEKIGIMDGVVDQKISVAEYNKIDEDDLINYEIIKDAYIEDEVEYYMVAHDVYASKDIKDHYFWFGTDDLGRDLWTRLWYGARISLYIGLFAALLDLTIGVVYGGVAGYFGGSKIDTLMMRFSEVFSGIPSLVILVVLLMLMDPGLAALSIAIGITGWMSAARIVRSQFLKLKGQEFVLASKTLGASHGRLIFRHLFPNVVGQLIVMITFTIPSAIFYEAFLAFIGLGIPVPVPSIGRLCSDGYQFMKTYPYMLFIPTILICILMLAINLFSNGLRDALDPKMK